MATQIQEASEKFKIGSRINMTLGRGGKFQGKVVGREKDGYLLVEYHSKDDPKAKPTKRRVNPLSARPVKIAAKGTK